MPWVDSSLNLLTTGGPKIYEKWQNKRTRRIVSSMILELVETDIGILPSVDRMVTKNYWRGVYLVQHAEEKGTFQKV